MKQDPLITYRSLIRGGLYSIPGGFDPPIRKRVHHKDLPPQPHSPKSTLATTPAESVWEHLGKIYAAFFSRVVVGGKAARQLELTVSMSPISPRRAVSGHRGAFFTAGSDPQARIPNASTPVPRPSWRVALTRRPAIQRRGPRPLGAVWALLSNLLQVCNGAKSPSNPRHIHDA
jgi:hypothetical protein